MEKLLRMVRHEKHAARPSMLCLYILQVPMMLLSYSIISYIVGLGVLVLRPLWLEPWGSDGKVRAPVLHRVCGCYVVANAKREQIAVFLVFYLVFALGTYIVVGFVIYHRFLPDLAQRTLREDDD